VVPKGIGDAVMHGNTFPALVLVKAGRAAPVPRVYFIYKVRFV